MRINGKVVAWSILSFALGTTVTFAQEMDESTANELSARPIDPNDIMMKRTLWRRVDLKEKQNLPMFAENNEITRHLLEAAKAGLIPAYKTDTCKTEISPEELHKKLLMPNQTAGLSEEEIAAGFGQKPADGGWDAKPADATKSKEEKVDDGWGAPTKKTAAVEDDGWGSPAPKKPATSKKGAVAKTEEKPVEEVKPADDFQQDVMTMATEEEFFPTQLSLLELKEDWTFDKKRSRLYMDIQSIGIYLPAEENSATGIEIPIAFFKYKDVERLFRSDSKKYIWYNTQNQAQHKNLADALDLRLFYGRITKFSNPNDKDFISIYKGEKEALIKSLQYEQELMELEHGLWEY